MAVVDLLHTEAAGLMVCGSYMMVVEMEVPHRMEAGSTVRRREVVAGSEIDHRSVPEYHMTAEVCFDWHKDVTAVEEVACNSNFLYHSVGTKSEEQIPYIPLAGYHAANIQNCFPATQISPIPQIWNCNVPIPNYDR